MKVIAFFSVEKHHEMNMVEENDDDNVIILLDLKTSDFEKKIVTFYRLVRNVIFRLILILFEIFPRIPLELMSLQVMENYCIMEEKFKQYL